MIVATERYFLGAWRMSRRIEHRSDGSLWTLEGCAVFSRAGDGLVCREEGVLTGPAGRFPTERTTVWHFGAEGRVEVAFADGRPFHAFDAGNPQACHLCGSDRYEVVYEFGAESWRSVWTVRGPAKDYVMTTVHRRG